MSNIPYQNVYYVSLANTEFRTSLRKIYTHHAATDVMGVLSQAYISQILKQAVDLNMKLPYLDDPKHVVAIKDYSVSALSLSQILAIPRTTILRCLASLIEQKYVIKGKNGYYIELVKFRRDMIPIYQKYYFNLNKISKN